MSNWILVSPISPDWSLWRQDTLYCVRPDSLSSHPDSFSTNPSKKSIISASPTQASNPCTQKITFLYPTVPLSTRAGTRPLRIAAFDMDSTLITTQSGNVFAKSIHDWKIMWPSIPSTLKELELRGDRIIVFTNQGSIHAGKNTAEQLARKFREVANALGVRMDVFMASGKDGYRKPNTLAWNACEMMLLEEGWRIDMENSYYVGDAAGRPKGWMKGKKKDFSASDRCFAWNLGIAFHTPEEFFLGAETNPYSLILDPRKLIGQTEEKHDDKNIISKTQELILLVGFPGSGKSTYYRKHFAPAGYVHVNQDILKTAPKCISATRDALTSGKSCVVDNTNADLVKRASFIAIAKSLNIPVRCMWFDISRGLAEHMNEYRAFISDGKIEPVSSIAYNVFKKNFIEPTDKEGFTEVQKIRFLPHFETEKQKQAFARFYDVDDYFNYGEQ